MKKANPRNSELAKIHIAKKDLGLDDDEYRDILYTVAGVRSAGDLDAYGRKKVIMHFKSRGFKVKQLSNYEKYGTPKNIDTHVNSEQLKKINALLADNQQHWNYVHGMTKKMFYKERAQLCTSHELQSIITALVLHFRRRQTKGKKNET